MPVLIGVNAQGLPEGTRFRGRKFCKSTGESRPNASNQNTQRHTMLVLIGVKRRWLPEGTRFRGRKFPKSTGESKSNAPIQSKIQLNLSFPKITSQRSSILTTNVILAGFVARFPRA